MSLFKLFKFMSFILFRYKFCHFFYFKNLIGIIIVIKRKRIDYYAKSLQAINQ